ncbi:hypothetical protein D3C81_223630 [compost metagenome]
MFTNLYEMACADGFKGTREDFVNALRGPTQKENTMNFGQTKQHSVSNQEHTVSKVNPSCNTFLQLLSSLLGPEFLEQLTPVTMQEFTPKAKNFEIPPKVVMAGEPRTVQDYITRKVIPEFFNKLAEAMGSLTGKDLIREQRKLIARLHKLMTYQARPMSIIPTAIHDEHEFFIYKCWIAEQICSNILDLTKGLTMVNDAAKAMAERQEACRINDEKQASEKKERELRNSAQDELADVLKDIGSLSKDELHLRLRGIAEQFAPTPPADLLKYREQTVATPAPSAKDAYKELSNSVDPKHSDIKISLNPGLARPIAPLLRDNPGQAAFCLQREPTLSAEQVSEFLASGRFTQDASHRRSSINPGMFTGMVPMHLMDSPMGCGMMPRHIATSE